jgi:hypothetical protein
MAKFFDKESSKFSNEIEEQKRLVVIIKQMRHYEKKFVLINLDAITDDDKRTIKAYRELLHKLNKYDLRDRVEFEYTREERGTIGNVSDREELKQRQSLFDKVVSDKNKLASKKIFTFSDENIKLLKSLQSNLIKLESVNKLSKENVTTNGKPSISLEEKIARRMKKIDYDFSLNNNSKKEELPDFFLENGDFKNSSSVLELSKKISVLESEFFKLDTNNIDSLALKVIREYQRLLIEFKRNSTLVRKAVLVNQPVSTLLCVPPSFISEYGIKDELQLNNVMNVFLKIDINNLNNDSIKIIHLLHNGLVNYNLEKNNQKKI